MPRTSFAMDIFSCGYFLPRVIFAGNFFHRHLFLWILFTECIFVGDIFHHGHLYLWILFTESHFAEDIFSCGCFLLSYIFTGDIFSWTSFSMDIFCFRCIAPQTSFSMDIFFHGQLYSCQIHFHKNLFKKGLVIPIYTHWLFHYHSIIFEIMF